MNDDSLTIEKYWFLQVFFAGPMYIDSYMVYKYLIMEACFIGMIESLCVNDFRLYLKANNSFIKS